MKKFILLLILMLVAVVVGSPGYEDPTSGYTEVDPNTDLALYGDPTYRVWVDDIGSEVVCYVKKDFGASYFGDFEMNVDTELHTTADNARSVVWAINDNYNVQQDMADNSEGLAIQWRDPSGGGTDVHFRLSAYSVPTNDDSQSLSLNTYYYLTIVRSGNLTYCKIYSDDGRETLVDSIGVEGDNTAYKQLFYAMATGSTTLSYDSYNEKLEIVSASGAASAKNVIIIR